MATASNLDNRLDPATDPLGPVGVAPLRRQLLLVLGVAWVVFWGLMAWVAVQDHQRSGGQLPWWRPVVHEFTSMLAATALLAWQWAQARRLDRWLAQPLQWFARVLVWLPLIGPAFVVMVFTLRGLIFSLAGQPYRHDPWGEAMVYEVPKLAIYFGLFAGVQFGARSYRAWHLERLRSERMARLTQQARLTQLTQQLQPHFLFNALNTISALIHTDPDRADALLGRLAALLRAATDAAQRPEQPLGDELALVRGYVEIMLERFGDRASIDWQVDEAALACRVPTLSLQVLLENVFKHVVEQRRAPTHIGVRVRLAQGVLAVSVQDDGAAPPREPVFGTGLGNLRQRLAGLHGAAAGVRLRAIEGGGGTVAEVWLPCAC
ncbi:MAG: sensor histidine kinase [Pseudomonadota bacterium]